MRYVFLICTLLFSYIIQAQTIPQVNNIPWYEFTKKLSVGERFRIPQDTLSLPTGATVRDTTGLIALKNGTLYRLYNRSWRAVMNGIDSVNRVGDSIIFYNNGVRLAGVYAQKRIYANRGLRFKTDTITLSNVVDSIRDDVVISASNYNKQIQIDAGVLNLKANSRISLAYGLGVGAGDSTYVDIATGFRMYALAWGDGNASILKANPYTTLGTITANRNVTFPYMEDYFKNGTFQYVLNKNTSAFNWNITGAPVEDGSGNALTTIGRGFWLFVWDNGKWIRQAGGSSGGSGTVTSVGTGTFLTGGPITTTGTVKLDTANAALKAYISANGGGVANLIIQNKGVGQQTWYTSGDTLYKKRVDSTWALTWSTRTDSTLQANIDTARIATRAWVVGQGYGAGGGGSTDTSLISPHFFKNGGNTFTAESTIGNKYNYDLLFMTNNQTNARFQASTGALLIATATNPSSYKLNVNGVTGTAGIRTTDVMYFNGSSAANRVIYANSLDVNTNSALTNANTAPFKFTNATPSSTSGTGYYRLLTLQKVTNRGTEDGEETALRIDFTVTGTATDKRAIEVVQGRTILKGVQTNVAAKTAAYTATDDDHTITGNATSAAFSITLPTAVGRTGLTYVIKKIDASANVVTVATTSSQTIDGAASYTSLSAQWKYVTVQSDGANWIIIGNN